MPPPTKRRKTEPKVAEINFDNSARQEYLTGFHKRKLQRAKQAQEAAERRAREDRIAERKKLREERKADLERHVQEVNALMRTADAEGDDEKRGEDDTDGEGEWGGIEEVEQPPPPIDHEAEYVDEDKYTTVTVEAMDASKEGLSKLAEDSEDGGEDTSQTRLEPAAADKKPNGGRNHAGKQKTVGNKPAKTKRKKFRYESKTERKFTRMKEKSKNSKQAKARKTA